ncbi:MAG TPA: ATP-binding cassette domain-containing protein [Nevskiaceae bacterium]|nr:ATP-binding cassette domain-containing protein [Nevskiaceae bacterium]
MLAIHQLEFQYPQSAKIRVPDVNLGQGDQCLVLGPSGCGKTTLLHLAAGLLKPSSGSVRLSGADLTGMDGTELDRFRGRNIGIVFQRLHLIPSLTVLQNLTVAQYCAGLAIDLERARQALAKLGVSNKAEALPAHLSQGQSQRVAIARAVVNQPQLILADEPTSSLDDANAQRVLELLIEQAKLCNAVLLIATHDARAKAVIQRRVELGAPA